MTDRLIDRITGLLKKRQWYEQPRLLAMFRLGEIRTDLREKNLHDTEDPLLKRADPGTQLDPEVRNSRSTDGTNNDLLYRRWDRWDGGSAATCRSTKPFPTRRT
jgi:hypothetical protein